MLVKQRSVSLTLFTLVLFVAYSFHFTRADGGEIVWEPIGPYGGTVNTLLATSDGRLYAGTENGGVFCSKDGGDTWFSAGCGALSVYSLVESGSTLYAGTQLQGVFRSEDGGNTWAAVNTGLTDLHVCSLTVLGKTLYAGTSRGRLFRFDADSNTWAQVGSQLPERRGGVGYDDVWALAASGTTLYAGIVGYVFRSDDGGNTWEQVGSKLTYYGDEDIENSPVRTFLIFDSTLYAGTYGGLYRLRAGDATGLSLTVG